MAAVQHHDVVAVAQRVVEVVQRGQHGHPARGELLGQVQHVELRRDVEMVGGLIEQQQARGLRECPGEVHLLPFPTRQGGDVAGRQVLRSRAGQGLLGDRHVLGGVRAPRRPVRRAAEEDDIEHVERHRRGGVLLDEGQLARAGAPRQ